MAGRLLANLIVMGGAVVGRAMLQAYRQAVVNANKTGAAQEAINGIKRVSKAMAQQEARQILGISEQSTWEEIVKKYDTMFERNAKNGSFYLQSKVHRAKECLEAAYQKPDVTNLRSPRCLVPFEALGLIDQFVHAAKDHLSVLSYAGGASGWLVVTRGTCLLGLEIMFYSGMDISVRSSD